MLVVVHAGVVRGLSTADVTERAAVEFLDTVVDVGQSTLANIAIAPATQAGIKGNRRRHLLTLVEVAGAGRPIDAVFSPNRPLKGSDMVRVSRSTSQLIGSPKPLLRTPSPPAFVHTDVVPVSSKGTSLIALIFTSIVKAKVKREPFTSSAS